MENTNRGIMLAAPVAIAALLLGLVAPGTALLGTQATTDSVGPHGYVTVSVIRDGQEVYRHEDHNLITNAGKDFLSIQAGATSGQTAGASFIGLSTNSKVTAATDTCISTADAGTTPVEITSGGLERGTTGVFAHTTGTNTYTITKTFTASATHTNVQRAGLFTAAANGDVCLGANDGTMFAGNAFSAVTLQSADQLTITWTITLT